MVKVGIKSTGERLLLAKYVIRQDITHNNIIVEYRATVRVWNANYDHRN